MIRMLVGCKWQNQTDDMLSETLIGETQEEPLKNTLKYYLYLDIVMNNATVWIGVEKPEISSTVNCNLEPLDSCELFNFTCKSLKTSLPLVIHFQTTPTIMNISNMEKDKEFFLLKSHSERLQL